MSVQVQLSKDSEKKLFADAGIRTHDPSLQAFSSLWLIPYQKLVASKLTNMDCILNSIANGSSIFSNIRYCPTARASLQNWQVPNLKKYWLASHKWIPGLFVSKCSMDMISLFNLHEEIFLVWTNSAYLSLFLSQEAQFTFAFNKYFIIWVIGLQRTSSSSPKLWLV